MDIESKKFYQFLVAFMFIILLGFGSDPQGQHASHKTRFSMRHAPTIDHVRERSSIQKNDSRVTALSWKPRAFLYENFLTERECDHLVGLARDHLEESTVVLETGEVVRNQFRTSLQMWIPKGHDGVVAGIEERIALWTMLPVEHGEQLQVLKYDKGGRFNPHHDYMNDVVLDESRGGQRVATVLMYLSDVAGGGETAFPSGIQISGPKPDDTWSECGKAGFGVKPRKGDAVLFFSLTPAAVVDPASLHAGCPVLEGEKWSATKWLHVRPFDAPKANASCSDLHMNCPMWALNGECKKSPDFMVGNSEYPGHCRRSCRVC